MSDKTFRQQVRTIVTGLCEDCPKKVAEEHPEYDGETRNECYGQCQEKRILAAHNAELDRIADQERVCKKCLKPYNAPSLCPVCEKRLTNDIP